MISFRNIYIIFKKEFLQLMKDKSVLFTNFLLPFFLLPLYMLIPLELAHFNFMSEQKAIKDPEPFRIAFVEGTRDDLVSHFREDKKFLLTDVNELSRDDFSLLQEKHDELKGLVKKRRSLSEKVKTDSKTLKVEVDSFLTIEKEIEKRTKYYHSFLVPGKLDAIIGTRDTGNNLQTLILTHPDHPKANVIESYVVSKVEALNKKISNNYKKQIGFENSKNEPFVLMNDIGLKMLSSFPRIAGIFLGAFILFQLLVAVYIPTINTTIGERDDFTYKALLMNPVSIYEIFLGKLLSITLQGLLTLLPYFLECILVYEWGSTNYIFGLDFQFTPFTLIVLIFGTISCAMLISSLCFLVASFAKSKTQAQSFMTFMVFAASAPIGMLSFFDVRLNEYSCLLPLANFALVTEALVANQYEYLHIILSILVNVLVSLVIVGFSLNAFVVQWKDSAGTRSMSDVLSFSRRKTTDLMPVHGILAFILCFAGFLYGSFIFSSFKLSLFSFLFPQLFFCLGTVVAIFVYSDLDFTKVINWRISTALESFKVLIGALFLSFGINLLASHSSIYPIMGMEMPEIFSRGTFSSYLGYFFLFALLPAFAEELLFRGVIFNGFRKQYNFTISSIISSLFFAIIHFSVFKTAHTFFLGLILAFLYERKGFIACFLMHLFFNSMSLWLSMSDSGQQIIGSLGSVSLPLAISSIVLSLFALQVWQNKFAIYFIRSK